MPNIKFMPHVTFKPNVSFKRYKAYKQNFAKVVGIAVHYYLGRTAKVKVLHPDIHSLTINGRPLSEVLRELTIPPEVRNDLPLHLS